MKKIIFIYLIISSIIYSQSIPLFRISTENSESHMQTKSIKSFVENLRSKTEGKLNIQYFHSAQLYRDSDAIEALNMNMVEMIVPGTWNVCKYAPEVNYLLFPDFYGEDKEFLKDYLNSEKGLKLIKSIEKNINVKILGEFMDLGYANIFTTEKKISNYSDIKGLKIRVAGGLPNKIRIEALGAYGSIISWADVQTNLINKNIDGLLTTFETIRSARLWEKGIQYAFLDKEYFPQYVPMVSISFWNKLDPDIQNIIVNTWAESVKRQNLEAEIIQKNAMDEAIKNGVIIIEPDIYEIKETKKKLLLIQNYFKTQLGL